jgi:hypothetical protein
MTERLDINGTLSSEQISSSYRNLLTIFEHNHVSRNRALEIISGTNPEDLMHALKKVNDLAYRENGNCGFDFRYSCNGGRVVSLLEISADDRNPNETIAMITTYDTSQSYLHCNPDGVFWQSRCFALRDEIRQAAEGDKIRTNSVMETVLE